MAFADTQTEYVRRNQIMLKDFILFEHPIFSNFWHKVN